MNWQTFFQNVPDFRINRRKRHLLVDILAISVCAVIAGADDFEEIAAYGRQKEAFLKTFLSLPSGIPSHDTFNRVFKFLDKDAFGNSLHQWSKQILSTINQSYQQINIDGKVLRSTAKSGAKKSGLCIVSAWVSDHKLVLGQQQVDAKSNEKTAVPKLLVTLDLVDSVVTIDAMACELKNADLIVSKQGHYILALKNNNKHIYEQVTDRMLKIKDQLIHNEHIDFGSGRIETRTCYVENDLSLYDDLADWSHLKSIIMIESQREVKNNISREIRYYLSDLLLDPKDFNHYIRNHWSIENKLHWQLDITFREDAQKTKTGNAPQNLATVRKLALQVLNQMNDQESIKNRRKIAGWDDNYLIKALSRI